MPDAPLPDDVLAEVAAGGAADAGDLPVELLGDFLAVLARAVVAGRPISSRQLRSYQALGDVAAQRGTALRALLDLYLSAAWRLWRHLPPVAAAAQDPDGVVVAGEVMLHAVDDVVAALSEGYQLARRALMRAQESERREFIDDLLTGSADVVGVLHRADGFGMDLSGPHSVALVVAEHAFGDADPLIGTLERAILGSKGDANALLASKAGRLVVVFPSPDRSAIEHVVGQLGKTLGPRAAGQATGRSGRRESLGAWQIGLGRPGTGADGVVGSYREAHDALELADRLHLHTPVVDARDLLVYQLLLRDRAALADLVDSTLGPLRNARGGAEPLLRTLDAYFAAGANAAHTGRALHLSVRAVTYRLQRIRELTGLDVTLAEQQLTLRVAVLGAGLLDWLAVPR